MHKFNQISRTFPTCTTDETQSTNCTTVQPVQLYSLHSSLQCSCSSSCCEPQAQVQAKYFSLAACLGLDTNYQGTDKREVFFGRSLPGELYNYLKTGANNGYIVNRVLTCLSLSFV